MNASFATNGAFIFLPQKVTNMKKTATLKTLFQKRYVFISLYFPG
jgi:hypothetical protein